jgi:2-dehydropantoate 2-reductase
MGMKIAVMGAGSIGGNLAGFLALGDEDVTIIDHWPEHVDAIKRDGLKLSGTRGEHTARPEALHVGDAWRVGEIDLLILGVKAYDNDWALALLEPYFGPAAVVLSAQNGVNEERIGARVGFGRVIGCEVLLSGETLGPGQVLLTSPNSRLVLGELHGRVTPRLQALQKTLEKACAIPLSTNIWGEIWSKLIPNTMSNPIAAVLNARVRELREQAAPRRCSIRLAAEATRVGHALGYDIAPVTGIGAQRFVDAAEGRDLEALEADLLAGALVAGDIYGSMPRDVQRGRKTELDAFSGYVIEKGREVGIPTPANEVVYHLVKDIEAGRLQPGPENVRLLPAA